MDVSSNITFLRAFAALNTVLLGLVAGAAISMYTFSIPVIETGGSISSLVMLRQFHQLITFGARYLQKGSRIQGILLALLTYLFYSHPDDEIAHRWEHFATALFVGAQVAWYEVVFVFPINDRLVEMEAQQLKAKTSVTDQNANQEIFRLLEEWGKDILDASLFHL
ncbi:hypothetical protein HJFPF1_08239 [Paramyrothecium foliicola]|nr:hypothetical protein HJFPF1_08239 [Paramyrothecium foliicola]